MRTYPRTSVIPASVAALGAVLATDAELLEGLETKAAASHAHAPGDVTGTAVITNDSRLSDARAPTAHAHGDLYYTETEADNLLSAKAASDHDHSGVYAAVANTVTGETGCAGGGQIGSNQVITLSTNAQIHAVGIVLDGGGVALTTGVKGYLHIPFACTITGVTALADQSGSIVVDVWKCTYAAFDVATHPVDADTITAATPITIEAAVKAQDLVLSDWTVACAAGDVLAFNVDSAATITHLSIILQVNKV